MTGSDWLTGRRGQALALGATLLVLFAIWAGCVQPLVTWYGEREETLRTQRALAERMEGLAATLPLLRRSVQSGSGGRDAGATLSGASDSVASATLQERVQAMATAAGATLTSVETLPAETTGAWRRIGLRITLTATWPVLTHLLQALDDAAPRMLVDDLHLHAAILVAHPVGLPLDTSFIVYAFRAGGAAGQTRP